MKNKVVPLRSELDARVLAVIAKFRASPELAEALEVSQMQRKAATGGSGGMETPCELPSRCQTAPFFISRNF